MVAPIAIGAGGAGLLAEAWGVRAGLLVGVAGLAAYGLWSLWRVERLIDAGRLEA